MALGRKLQESGFLGCCQHFFSVYAYMSSKTCPFTSRETCGRGRPRIWVAKRVCLPVEKRTLEEGLSTCFPACRRVFSYKKGLPAGLPTRFFLHDAFFLYEGSADAFFPIKKPPNAPAKLPTRFSCTTCFFLCEVPADAFFPIRKTFGKLVSLKTPGWFS